MYFGTAGRPSMTNGAPLRPRVLALELRPLGPAEATWPALRTRASAYPGAMKPRPSVPGCPEAHRQALALRHCARSTDVCIIEGNAADLNDEARFGVGVDDMPS